jgi:hypothetical protein
MRTAGWAIINGKEIQGKGTKGSGILDSHAFARALQSEIRWFERKRTRFVVLLFQLFPGPLTETGIVEQRMSRILGASARVNGLAAKLSSRRFALLLRDADPKSAVAIGREVCGRLAESSTECVEVDGGIFPDDTEMIQSLSRALAHPRAR